MMTLEIAKKIAKKEGHNSKSRICDIAEILIKLADLSYESPDPLNKLIKVGIARFNYAQKLKAKNVEPT